MIKEIILTSRTYILGVFLILAIAIFNFNSVNIDDVGSEYTETKIEIDQTESIQPYCDGATYNEVKNHKLQTIDLYKYRNYQFKSLEYKFNECLY